MLEFIEFLITQVKKREIKNHNDGLVTGFQMLYSDRDL